MNTLDTGWKSFLKLCLAIQEERTLALFLELMLTPEEKQNLATRYLIIQALLKEEQTQREIAKDLNVSIAKITRGSNELKKLDKRLLELLKSRL
ncbi:MAG: trp operon repressor [Gammaproteobacteria bacterium]